MKNVHHLTAAVLLTAQMALGVGYSPDIWLDGSDASSIVLSSGQVQQWNDKSGNDYHAIAPASARRPDYDNSTGAVVFDGVDDALRISNGSSFGSGNQVTFFVVAQLNDATKEISILTDDSYTTFCKRFSLHFSPWSTTGFFPLISGTSMQHVIKDFDLHMVSARFDGSTFSSGIDGSTPPKQTSATPNNTGTSSDLMLGGPVNLSTSKFMDGQICEVIIYKKALSAVEVAAVEKYLHNKWGIPLAGNHPFIDSDFGVVAGERFSVAENAAVGTGVGTMSAISANPGFTPQDWRIEPEGGLDKTWDIGAFTINPASGEISVADSSKLDFEQYQTHRIAVSVSDGTNRSAGIEVDIDVIDVADGDPAKVYSQLWGVAGELWDSHDRLPGYSTAGYRLGEEAIPDYAGWPVVNVTTHGAIPNDGLDDSAEIQAAINAAPASGAIIYLPAGQFILENFLTIARSKLILRGAGMGAGGTVIYCPKHMTELGKHYLFDHLIVANGNWWETSSEAFPAGEAKRGDRTVLLTTAPGWSPGQLVNIELNEAGTDIIGTLWHHLHNGHGVPPPDAGYPINPISGRWAYTVDRIEGKLVTFKEPLRADIRMEWTPRLVTLSGVLEEVGMEDFKMEFLSTPQPGHLAELGYNGIRLENCKNSWIQRVTFQDSDNPMALKRSLHCNIENVHFTGRAGHHGIDVRYNGNNLIRNLTFDQTSTFYHSVTLNHQTAGNVVSDVSGNQPTSCDFHGDTPCQNLWTQLTTEWNYNSSGASSAQPHAGFGNTYWNNTGTTAGEPGDNYKLLGTTVVGPISMSDSHTFSREWYENIQSVEPANLYDAQFAHRLNPPVDPAFAVGTFGVRTNWFERDPSRWHVSAGADPAYTLRFGEAPAVPGNRLGEYAIFTTASKTDIGMLAMTLEDLTRQPAADLALVLGYQDDENYLYASVSATNGAQIVRVQNGTGSVLSSDPAILLASNPPSSGSGATSVWKNISFARSGNTVELIYDGQNLQATDTVFTSGYAGIGSTLGTAAFKVDTDGDGLTDAQEIALGTDPNDPDSGFGIDGAPLPIPGKIEITWPSATGVLYRIWESPDLDSWIVARDWTNALTPPADMLELDLSPSNGFFKVEAEIQ